MSDGIRIGNYVAYTTQRQVLRDSVREFSLEGPCNSRCMGRTNVEHSIHVYPISMAQYMQVRGLSIAEKSEQNKNEELEKLRNWHQSQTFT